MIIDIRNINSSPNAVLPLSSPHSLVHPPPPLAVPIPPLQKIPTKIPSKLGKKAPQIS